MYPPLSHPYLPNLYIKLKGAHFPSFHGTFNSPFWEVAAASPPWLSRWTRSWLEFLHGDSALQSFCYIPMELYPIPNILLMEEIPNNHLGFIKPGVNTGKNYQPQLVSLISSINSISSLETATVFPSPRIQENIPCAPRSVHCPVLLTSKTRVLFTCSVTTNGFSWWFEAGFGML